MDQTITFYDVFISTLRWAVGLSAGCIFGVFFGVLSHYVRWFGQATQWLFDFFRALPIIGLVPVVQWWLGIDEIGKIGLICWGVMFPVWISVRSYGGKRLDEIEVILAAQRVGAMERFRIYHFPRLLAGIMRGVEIGIGVAWLCVVGAEFIGTLTWGFWAGGLGYKLQLAFDLNHWRSGMAALGLFGVLGLASSRLWRFAVSSALKRSRGFDPLQWGQSG